ncbi:b8563038-cc9e-4709-96cb-8609c40021a2 [Thermothielavioides terrestris]|uniref:B8563038-cc9e-4709-96cb-8609c40021a2 n=1 Tax=Thermothielavioides terrestris TaxID=2587410 RepID=A0A446B745_9PEZI|nr:b8563038-cc9e-4709-96cb-8609c40021a2 [Thermothielavioides terrestris]
MDFIRGLYD